MPAEPAVKRCVSFIDGQNLYHAARTAFGYTYPNYDPLALAQTVAAREGWTSCQIRFYTGVPDATDKPQWHHFWTHKLAIMVRRGIHVYSRRLRYRNEAVRLPDGSEKTILVGEEKGIDMRIGIDVIRMAHLSEYDVALIFSQDQDLTEVAEEIRTISREQNRWIRIASAFPVSPTARTRRGIDKTDWIHVDRPLYDSCLDPRDYRLRTPPSP